MGRMDQKKKGKSKPKLKTPPKRKSLSPLMQLVATISLFCVVFVFLIGLSYLPGVRKNIDFSVRNRVAKVLNWAYPDYEIATIAANRNQEKDNLLTIGYISKREIQEMASRQNTGTGYMNLSFHNTQLRIRELIVTPILLLVLLFFFTPIKLKQKAISGSIGLLVLYGLILFKIIAILGYSITQTYAPENISLIQKSIPYFSSPGLVFLIVLIIWMALVLPFIDKKSFEKYFKVLG